MPDITCRKGGSPAVAAILAARRGSSQDGRSIRQHGVDLDVADIEKPWRPLPRSIE